MSKITLLVVDKREIFRKGLACILDKYPDITRISTCASDQEAIKEVIERAYIQGIHGNQDEAIVKSGFHQDFAMLVLQENKIEKVPVDLWLERVEGMKADNPEMCTAETRYNFELVDSAEYAAVTKIDVWKGQVHFSTDYMLLYKFEEGWRIVSKVFSIPA